MYRPDLFKMDNTEEIQAVVGAFPFATLLSSGDDSTEAPEATHLPMLWHADPKPLGSLIGHVAKANPHWQSFASGKRSARAIFHGPHGYISPRWYHSRSTSGRVLPTWNYQTVHAIGRVEVMTAPATLRDMVIELTEAFEPADGDQWRLDEAPANFIDGMLKGIVGLTLTIERWEGKAKMNQNRSKADWQSAIAGVTSSGDDALAEAMATLYEAKHGSE